MLRSKKAPITSCAVDPDALLAARQGVPAGEYHVDPDALLAARQGVPEGEYH